MELQLVESNPVRLIKRLSAKSAERQVSLSFGDASLMAERCPEWVQRIIRTANEIP
jgi:hypothetical protein